MKTPKRLPLKVSEADWLSALLDARTFIEVDMHRFPFRFAPPGDWDTKEQAVGEHIIYFVARGSCEAVVEGKRFELTTGDMCWVCPGVLFRFSAGRNLGTILQRFRLSVRRRSRELRLAWNQRLFRNAHAAAECSRELVEEQGADRFAKQRLAALAVLFSAKAFEARERRSRAPGLSMEVRRRISQYVLDEQNHRTTIGDLAKLAGLSADYFSRQFKMAYGTSPREWLLKQRLRHASGLLAETDDRISQIAIRLGYPDVYLFSRQFAAEFGVSPRSWRRSHGSAGG